jgi:hypothetical protein
MTRDATLDISHQRAGRPRSQENPMKDFFVHLGAQVAVAAGTAAALTLAHANYSDLGAYGPAAQAGAAILAEAWNQFFPAK